MVQSPSWEANRFAASQEIPRISRNPKVHYRTHKRPPPVSILGQPNPVHIPTSHILEIHPYIIHPSSLFVCCAMFPLETPPRRSEWWSSLPTLASLQERSLPIKQRVLQELQVKVVELQPFCNQLRMLNLCLFLNLVTFHSFTFLLQQTCSQRQKLNELSLRKLTFCLSLMEPLPRIAIFVMVSSWSLFRELPLGPSSFPTKLN